LENQMNKMTAPLRRPGVSSKRWPRRAVVVIALAGAFAVAGCQAGDSLAGPTWQWAAEQEPAAAAAGQPAAPDAARYTIEFHLDGTVNVEADCHDLTGTYAVGVPLDLTINVADPALADCGGASLAVDFLEDLGRISSYSTGGGELNLFFAEDAAGMRFTLQP
jgi:hypothetical protein